MATSSSGTSSPTQTFERIMRKLPVTCEPSITSVQGYIDNQSQTGSMNDEAPHGLDHPGNANLSMDVYETFQT